MKRIKSRVVLRVLLPMVVAGMGVVPLLFASEQYSIVDLGTLGGTYSTAMAINGNGQVVGYSTTDSGETQAFLWQRDRKQGWKKGKMIDLGTLGGTYSYPWAINENGQIVGESTIASGNTHAFLWQPGVNPGEGSMKDLGTLGGLKSESFACAINGSGQVVGTSRTESGKLHAFLWQLGVNSDEGIMKDLGTLGGSESFAYGINEGGQVMGYSQTKLIQPNGDEYGEPHAFLWQPLGENGEMIDLGTLGGLYSVANGINGSGQIVGQSTIISGYWHAFVWGPDGGDMIELGTLVGSENQAYANAINGSGKIVGGSDTGLGETHAVLWIMRGSSR